MNKYLSSLMSYLGFISESSPDLTNDIRLANVNITHLRFSWSNKIVHSVCSDTVSYHVQTTNCGECPDMTISTTILCALPIQEIGRDCIFRLQSQVCGNINGTTQSITVTPRGIQKCMVTIIFISIICYQHSS
jgi:hypothetical protein